MAGAKTAAQIRPARAAWMLLRSAPVWLLGAALGLVLLRGFSCGEYRREWGGDGTRGRSRLLAYLSRPFPCQEPIPGTAPVLRGTVRTLRGGAGASGWEKEHRHWSPFHVIPPSSLSAPFSSPLSRTLPFQELGTIPGAPSRRLDVHCLHG